MGRDTMRIHFASSAVGAGTDTFSVDVNCDDELWWGTVEISGTASVIDIEGTGSEPSLLPILRRLAVEKRRRAALARLVVDLDVYRRFRLLGGS